MRLEQLQYFVEVARSGSFTVAADLLHISQPSVSQAIANLEEELDVTLFERSRAGTRLTRTGQLLFVKAQNIINIVNEIRDEARAETDSITGDLSIASIPSMCNAFLSDVLSSFKRMYPFVRVEVHEEGTNQVIREVLSNRAQIGLVSCVADESLDDNIEFYPLLSGKYRLCIGKGSSIPLLDPMPVEYIRNAPIIALQPGFRQHDYLKRILKTDELNILLTMGYTEAAKKMIASGIAVGYYPDFSVLRDPYVQSGDIMAVEIQNNDLLLNFGWIWSKNYHPTRASVEFTKTLKSVISKI